MDRGPIPLSLHAAIEPLVAIVIIAAPWIFGFSAVDEAKVVCIVVGVVMLIAGSMTDWRMALVRVIPLRVHLMTDLLLGAVLIVSPFVLGYGDEGGATRFQVIAGALELMTALGTRWDPAEAAPSAVDRRSRSTPAH
ncbi:MAG TPA: SPW repeat protein [Solirubrobacterales bacterium]|nr:SPW repeat protein [Solirubrobacterales bacterium]